jgi:cytosine/creatinine deaminase
VALGQDDIVDAYYPFGTHDLVEVAFLVAHVLHRYTEDDAATLLDMITGEAAVAVGLPRPRLDVGAPASMVVLEGSTPREVLRRHASPRTVIRAGEVLAQGTRSTTFAASVPTIPSLTDHLR